MPLPLLIPTEIVSANISVHLTGVPLRSCVMTEDNSLLCCIKDEGRPLGFGNQIQESNRPMRHLLRVFVVNDREN